MARKAGKVINNLVAKHARMFNKSSVQRDKTKYNKKRKHKGQSHE